MKLKTEKIKEGVTIKLLKASMYMPLMKHFLLSYLERRIYKSTVEGATTSLRTIQIKKFYFLRALLHCAYRNLEKGYISRKVGKRMINTLIKNVLSKEKYQIKAPKKFYEEYGIWPPGFIVISPTQRCNLNCKGCYASAKAIAPTLPFNITERIVREAHDIFGNRFITISGGEPFMYKENGKTLFDIWEKYSDMFFLVYTNGTLITKEVAFRLAKLGNVTPAISLEGFEEETDKRRGEGTFKKILEAVKNLKKAGVPFGVSITATQENINTLLRDEFYDFIFLKLGASYIWLFQLMPIGKARVIKELMPTAEQRFELLKKWEDLVEKKRYCIADFWNYGFLSDGCIAYGRAGGYFYIDWNGNILPCVFIPYYEDNIIDLYKEGKNLKDALFSQLFKRGRKWQDDYGYAHPKEPKNWLMPCSIRDHFKNFKKNILTRNSLPQDKDAAFAITSKDFEKFLDDFDKKFAKLTDPVWKKEFLN